LIKVNGPDFGRIFFIKKISKAPKIIPVGGEIQPIPAKKTSVTVIRR
jgi:hypothetical protein